MGHGQYLVYIPSHQFLKSVLSSGFGNIANDIVFWSVLSLSKPQLNFQKIKMSCLGTTFHYGKFWL